VSKIRFAAKRNPSWALEGKVVEVECLRVGEVEEDPGTWRLPSGAEAAKFAGLEGERDLLRFRGRKGQSGFGGTIIVNIKTHEDTGSEKAEFCVRRGIR
jgi:hypothetical protein